MLGVKATAILEIYFSERECRDSNPGWLGRKHERCLGAIMTNWVKLNRRQINDE